MDSRIVVIAWSMLVRDRSMSSPANASFLRRVPGPVLSQRLADLAINCACRCNAAKPSITLSAVTQTPFTVCPILVHLHGFRQRQLDHLTQQCTSKPCTSTEDAYLTSPTSLTLPRSARRRRARVAPTTRSCVG